MNRQTHLCRRDGVYQIQLRVTGFSKRSWLLRFSLATRDYAEAKARLNTSLHWALRMQNPAAFSANIDFIVARTLHFDREGRTTGCFQASERRHFLECAKRMLDDWRAAKACPITYRDIYAREGDLVACIEKLGNEVRNAIKEYGDGATSCDYMNPPEDPFGYSVRDGIVTRVLPWDLHDRWPEVARLPEHMRPKSRYKVGDRFPGEAQSAGTGTNKPTARAAEAAACNVTEPGTGRVDRLSPEAANAGYDGGALFRRNDDRLRSPISTAPLGKPMSVLLDLFLDELAQEAGGKRTADKDLRPYIEFWIHILGDKVLADYSREDARKFCCALNEIPHPKGMRAQTPIERRAYALKHGWDGLQPLSATTLENRYFTAMRRLYSWAREANHADCSTPKLKIMGEEVTGALPRDAFTNGEVRKLFSLPKFSGSQRSNGKAEGPFLNQDWAYWGYIILYLAGLRPGEIAQLEIEDIRSFEGILYFDLRPFDPEKGRIALKHMKTLKSENASRLVPIHPIMVELGLIERAKTLKALGHKRLFPDFKWRTLADGKVKHGDALARDWQKRKADVTTRANVSAYSGRHSMASLLDKLKIPNRDRERILGHSHPGVTGRYGRKGALPEDVLQAFIANDSEIVRWMREHLVAVCDRAERERKLVTD